MLSGDARRISKLSNGPDASRWNSSRLQFSPDEQAFRDAVSTAISVLPEEQRAVVHLKIWEDQTFAEIAETLGIPANTAASRYRYALDKLEGLLRPICAP
jgi:RNA polymerase sigma factor (sigma-70 family)